VKIPAFALVAALFTLSGCSTTQEILLAKSNSTRVIQTIARSPGDSVAEDMNKNIEDAFTAQGIEVKAALPPETRKAPDVDAIFIYSDQWRWDLVMYLRALTINIFDAESGDLLISGSWHDSTLHGFRDPREVSHNLVADMISKLKAATNKQKQ
jgi:hypothetical protein